MAPNEHYFYSSPSLQGPSSSSPILHGEFPPGFRFEPHDWELIVHYLLCHIHDLGLPKGINIPERNILNHHPDELQRMFNGGIEGKMYFFTPRERMHEEGSRVKRSLVHGLGFWKTTGKDENVKYDNRVVGIRKAFAFHEENGKGATGWIMQEYRLTDTKTDGVVLCKIYKNSRRSRS